MRRRVTYAPYLGTVIGVLIAILVLAKTESLPLAILTFIGAGGIVGIIWWNVEKLIYKGADAAGVAVHNAINRRKEANDPHTSQKLSSLYGGSQDARTNTSVPQKSNPSGTAAVFTDAAQQSPAQPTVSASVQTTESTSVQAVQPSVQKTPDSPVVPKESTSTNRVSQNSLASNAANENVKIDTKSAQKLLGSHPPAQNRSGIIYAARNDTTRNNAPKSIVYSSAPTPLGGFLLAIVIIYYICFGLMLTLGFWTAISLFGTAALLHSFGAKTGFIVFLGIVLVVISVGVAVVCFKFARKISRRDPSFLDYFHKAFIVCAILEILLLILVSTVKFYGSTLTEYSGSLVGEMIVAILQGTAGTIGLTIYFVRSQRVHEYMGNEEYLEQSPFTRKYAYRFAVPEQTDVSLQSNTAQSGCRMDPSCSSSPALNYAASYCCICGKPLSVDHAVLFVSKDGSEARADRTCYEALRDLGTSMDREVVIRAKQYIYGKWTTYHKTELADYLERYNQSAIAFLREKEESDDKRR